MAFQQFFVTPYMSRSYREKMQPYFQSDRKQKNSIHKTKKCIYNKRNEKQIVGKKEHNQKITQNEKSPFCSLSKKAMQQ